MIVRELITKLGFETDEASLRRTEQRVKAVARGMETAGRRFSLLVTLPIVGVGAGLLKVTSDVEQLQVAFTTMLGSAEKADSMIRQLYQFAATTPFEIAEIGGVAKQLLAVGIEQENIIETMRNLGNVSAGLSVPMSRLALNYGQVKTQAKLTGRELRDFAIAGVPLAAELAKILGVSQAEINDMVSAGEIGFDAVQQAFKNMASEGGRFANLMEKQAKTLGGLWSNFKDVIYIVATRFGKVFVAVTRLKPRFEFLINALGKLGDKFENLDESTVKWIIAIAGFAAAIGPALLIFAKLSTMGFAIIRMLSFMSVAWAKAGTAAALAQIKFALVPIAVAAIIAALVLFIQDLYTWIKGGDSLLGDWLGSWVDFKDKLIETFGAIIAPFADMLIGLKDIIVGIFQLIYAAFTGDSKAAIEAVTKIWQGFVAYMERGSEFIVEALKLLFLKALPALADAGIALVKMAFQKLIEIATNVSQVLFDVIEAKFPFIASLLKKAGAFTAGAVGTAGEFLGGAFTGEPVFAGAAAAGTPTIGSTNVVKIDSNIKMEIPAGTPEAQAAYIENNVRKVVQEENEKMIRHVIATNPEVEE